MTEDIRSLYESVVREKNALAENIEKLLDHVGNRSHCKGCGIEIWWVTHKNGKRAPYIKSGSNHFIDCHSANQFRKQI